MRTRSARRRGRRLALPAALAALALLPAGAAAAGGGTSASGGGDNCVNRSKAKLSNGKAVPPCEAPRRVKKVIRAANEIATGKGYCYGGGHSSFKSKCYDCSGAVSYALKGGDFVKSPMPSSGYYSWGKKGRGNWFTVYTKSSHMYLVVAGLRFDTSMTAGKGPGWSSQMRSDQGSFRKRHKPRY